MDSKKTWLLEMYSKMGDNKLDEPTSVKENCYLIIKGSQLMVVEKNKAMESICLLGGGGTIQVHYSNQFVGISVIHNQKVQVTSKFKIQFAQSCGKSAEYNCQEAVNLLAKFVPVIEHPSHRGWKPTEHVLKTMAQVMKDILERDPEILKTSELVLQDKEIAELAQECLLDPGFPALVAKVEDLLENRSGDDV